jgi:hypothetical protein
MTVFTKIASEPIFHADSHRWCFVGTLRRVVDAEFQHSCHDVRSLHTVSTKAILCPEGEADMQPI